MHVQKSAFIIAVAMLIGYAVKSQPVFTADSIWKKAKTLKNDTLKLKEYLKAANLFYDVGKKDEVEAILNECRTIFRKTKPVAEEVELYRLMGDIYGYGGDAKKRMLYADSMLNISKKAGYKFGEAKGLLAKAVAYSFASNMEEAIKYYTPAAALFQSMGENEWLARTYKGMGNILLQATKNNEAIRVYKLAAVIYQKVNKLTDAGLVYGNIVRAFMTDNNLDSAMFYNEKATAMSVNTPPGHPLHFSINISEAELQARKKNFVLAEKAIQKAMEVAEMQNIPGMLGAVYTIKSSVASSQNKFAEALKYDLLSQEIHKKSGNFSQLAHSYLNISKDYYKLGNYKEAYDNRIKFIAINDSLFSASSAEQINELNVKYETSQKEKTIAEQQLAISQKNVRMRTLFISLAAIAVALLLLSLFYVQRKKTYNQSLITLKKEQDISLLKALMTGEEKERSRLARELHDGLGGILAAAQMQVSNLEIVDTETQLNNKQKAAELVNRAATESRRIAHNLLPETLLRFGLDEALKEYSASITESKLLKLDYESIGVALPLEQSVELSIYRIIQELVNNIVKHSGATEALVQLHRQQTVLSVTVEDNGSGFSPSAKKQGIGLSNIESRISYLNGSMDIRSEEKKGTSVYIEIQLDKNARA